MKSVRRPGKRKREKLYAPGRQITAASTVTTGAVRKLYRTADPPSPLVKTHSHHFKEYDCGNTLGYRHSSVNAHRNNVSSGSSRKQLSPKTRISPNARRNSGTSQNQVRRRPVGAECSLASETALIR